MMNNKISGYEISSKHPRGAFYGTRIVCVALLAVMFLLGTRSEAQTAKYPQTIVFMTDFGVVDDSVALCKGVMYSIMPEVRIVDLTHEVTPFSILDGARFLYGATPVSYTHLDVYKRQGQ